MAIKTLIGGVSGTGKSCSMRNLVGAAVVNPVNKPLPFKHNFEMLNGVVDSDEIVKFMEETDKKVIVVDDFQYLLSIPYMNRIKETGWDKYNDFATNYFDIIRACDRLPEDVTVYFMTHTEVLEDGTETVKLIGKLLREKICIEGLFTTVLKTLVNDGKYYFITQNSGKDTVKSPMGMFDSYAIDNDLAYVDAKIRSYYEIGEDFKTDEEMVELDEEAKREEIQKPEPKAKRRRSVKPQNEETGSKESENAENEPVKTTDESKPLRQRKKRDEVTDPTVEEAFTPVESTEADTPAPKRRRRRSVEE